MLVCCKHFMAVVFLGDQRCPVCSTAKRLWSKYEKDFKRARVSGQGRRLRGLKPLLRALTLEEVEGI